jgi:hypothetical protein
LHPEVCIAALRVRFGYLSVLYRWTFGAVTDARCILFLVKYLWR